MTHPSDMAVLVEQARRICAQHDPNKGYQYLEGQRDDYMPMTAVIAALTKVAPPVEGESVQKMHEIPAGMVPWHGGDSAPEDWDGGPCLCRDGTQHTPNEDPGNDWSHDPRWGDPDSDIIAYTPKATPQTVPANAELSGRDGEPDADREQWETCNCPEPPFDDEVVYDRNLSPRCPRCNVALGGDPMTALERAARAAEEADEPTPAELPALPSREEIESRAKYLFENQPNTSRFAAGHGGWNGIGGAVKEAWREYARGLPQPGCEVAALHPPASVAEVQISWRGGEPPKDGAVFYGHTWSPFRWKDYSPKSEQARHGIKGRWQTMNEFGGWENAKAPDEWASAEQIEARRAALSQPVEAQ